MKRTCLQTITTCPDSSGNTHENESCEFHPTTKKTNYLRMKESMFAIVEIHGYLLTLEKQFFRKLIDQKSKIVPGISIDSGN